MHASVRILIEYTASNLHHVRNGSSGGLVCLLWVLGGDSPLVFIIIS